MRKFVIASDSFKGSLSSREFADSAGKGIKDVLSDCEIVKVIVADGGEGFTEALLASRGGMMVETRVHDPIMRPVSARYGILDDKNTAVIECAAASGLTLLTRRERDPAKTTTYGTGEQITDALDKGCRKFIIGTGGTATNDAGIGILKALGFRFLDRYGKELGSGGETLYEIAAVDGSNSDPRIYESEFTVAVDVKASFCGRSGAAHVFATQKGADKDKVLLLDSGLCNLNRLVKTLKGTDLNAIPGSGAGGGVAGGLVAFLGARPVNGIDFVLEAAGFDKKIAGAEMIITGEGKIDSQTLTGKAPYGILKYASKYGIPVIAVAGKVEDKEKLLQAGFAGIYQLTTSNDPAVDPLDPITASENVRRTVAVIVKAHKYKGSK